ncbi:hypothetical protein [Hwanghaeella sp.]|uniref:hypothetical protein n=1 Tax=Hwanghaeella sp. TaxID=2605943 RepID=UPI003CCB9CEF
MSDDTSTDCGDDKKPNEADEGPNAADKEAAHQLLSELRTRIAVQPLPYQHGVEKGALKSLYEIFNHARQAMHANAGCARFAELASTYLNEDIRPVTARWHRGLEDGLLDTRDGGSAFRTDFKKLQPRLVTFAKELHLMAYGTELGTLPKPAPITDTLLKELLADVEFGIPGGDLTFTKSAGKGEAERVSWEAINQAERRQIADTRDARKGNRNAAPAGRSTRSATVITNAVGLALSGGGIRSASFCLGVCQTLADKRILPNVDVLSTVSGGGYTGSFLTRRIINPEFDALKNRNGPDTPAIHWLRQRARYLDGGSAIGYWRMVAGILSGMLLNWTAPATVIALTALTLHFLSSVWPTLSDYLWYLAAGSALAGFIFYAVSLRYLGSTQNRAAAGLWLLAALLAGSALLVQAYRVWADPSSFGDWLSTTLTAAAGLSASLPVLARTFPGFGGKLVRKLAMRAAVVLAAIAVPAIAIAFLFILYKLGAYGTDTVVVSNGGPHWVTRLAQIAEDHLPLPSGCPPGYVLLFCIFVVFMLLAVFTVDINRTGPHRLYRDRLARTFIHFRPEDETAPPVIKLSGINDTDMAPYHLINATVNLPSSRTVSLRERKSDFFIFSKYFCGSTATGYWRTKDWESANDSLDLPTAVATSGAAVAPHMALVAGGAASSLLAFLNLRLGIWTQRPRKEKKKFPLLNRPGFGLMFREMFGWKMDEEQRWFFLSDGGHIENSGVYELLRRRCKFIVAVDGSADPSGSFEALMTVVRHAQIDMGIEIAPSLDEMRPNAETGMVQTHATLCIVNYPPEARDTKGKDEGERKDKDSKPVGDKGLLLYLKSSVSGNESELIKVYRAANPDFPHQTTADQFFDEEQFEAYRQLGVHVAEGMFASPLLNDGKNDELCSQKPVEDWFRRLARNLLHIEDIV